MARSYTTTIRIKCWKEHTCISCGAAYSYEFARKIVGKGRKPDVSQRDAQKKVEKTLLTAVDLHPCPACGIYQPDMIGQKRRRWHGWVLLIGLMAFGGALIVRATDFVPANTLTWIIVGIGLLASLQLFGKELKNFNADPEANKARAAGEIEAGKVRHGSGESAIAAEEWLRVPRSMAQRVSPILLLIAVVLLASPELLRMAKGWPVNRLAYPPVVGPGDVARIYMPGKIQSLNGFWRGTPTVTLSESGSEDHAISVNATTNEKNWGSSINADSDNERNSETPWVDVEMPADESLVGKTVQCDVVLNIEYPQKSGDSQFETVTGVMSQQASLHLASAGAGTLYNQVWWYGGVGGMVILLGTTLLLMGSAQGLQKKANATKIVNPAAAT